MVKGKEQPAHFISLISSFDVSCSTCIHSLHPKFKDSDRHIGVLSVTTKENFLMMGLR